MSSRESQDSFDEQDTNFYFLKMTFIDPVDPV